MRITEKYKIRKAKWLGSKQRVFRQILVSTLSFITYPFTNFKNSDKSKYNYFKSIYNGGVDDLLFDGKSHIYLNQYLNNISHNDLESKSLLDIGSGDGSLFYWVINAKVGLKEYIGIDFAHEQTTLSENARIIKVEIKNYKFEIQASPDYIFATNVLVYLSDEELRVFLNKINFKTRFALIEPVPGIFWDKHFDGIKLYYRSPNEILCFFKKLNWKYISGSIDYGFILSKKAGLFPLSCCIILEN